MEMHVRKEGAFLRRGYTTGTCAAAAGKAAVRALFAGEVLDKVNIRLPGGNNAEIAVRSVELGADHARCCVLKDAGDDPDVTNGAEIWAEAREINAGISVKGGAGVGVVTKRGLQISPGEAAINPVPREMILNCVREVLPEGRGVEVTISVPDGEMLARRTMNPRLGIVGGISILGTTGIVEPRSVEAFRNSLLPQLDIALAAGYDEPVLTPGRIGERNATARGIPRDAIVQMGNFLGFMLHACAERGVKNVLLFGSLGKLAKLAAGYLYTHSKASASGLRIIAARAAEIGAEPRVVEEVANANTTEEALDILRRNDLLGALDLVAKDARKAAEEHVGGGLKVGVVLASLRGEIVGKCMAGGSRWEGYLS